MAEPIASLPSLPPLGPVGSLPTLDTDALARNQQGFAAVLGRATGLDQARTDQERSRALAEQFVAQSFLLPILKQLRATNAAAAPFAPTGGEKQLRALQDAELAQRIAHATHFPLVDRLARDLLKRAGKDAAGREAGPELQGVNTRAIGD